jgi:lambda family phage portal protein
MAFSDLERAACEQWFEGGDVFIRLHFSAFGSSDIPLALELIESERLADEHEITPQPGEQISMGVGHDPFGRAIAYYVHKHHQNYLFGLPREGPDEILRIPASEVIHIRMVTRWPQSRGVPGLHAVIDRLEQIGGFETAALVAARSGAQNLGFFENQAFPDGMGEKQEDGSGIIDMQEGQWVELPPGLHPIMHDPKYPHEAFDPFIRTSIRGLAAGTGPSYEAVSRDYSQSNYSSSRLAELDSRDYWRILQKWWIRSFRDVLHRVWLQQAVFSAAIPEINRSAYLADQDKYEAVKWKPRGWSWVDPTKEVAAYKEAERAGYITKTDVIAQTAGGMDIEDMIATRRQELDMLAEAGLTTDTTDIQFEPLDDEPEAETEGDEDPRPSPRLVGGSDGK